MFRHAIVRKPGPNFCDGITTADLGRPDYERALAQHEQYCRVLGEQGINVTILEADDRYPDGCFVEDMAVVTPRCAVITRSGALVRQGEEAAIEQVLAAYLPIERIEPPAVVDGGDILQIADHFYIGLSRRTDPVGASQLAAILKKHGYESSTVPVDSVLHLQTGVTWVGGRQLACIEGFAARSEFVGFDRLVVPPQDDYSANCLHVNGVTLVPAGFDATRDALAKLGHRVVEVEMSEFRKMDGGLTCLSILF